MEEAKQIEFQPNLHPVFVFRTFSLGVLLGFIIGFWFIQPPILILIFLAITVVCIGRKIIPPLLGIFIIGILLAWWRGNGFISSPPVEVFIGQQEFTARISELPRLGEKTRRYIAETISPLPGLRVAVIAGPWPEFYYGDQIKLNCPGVELMDFKPYNNRGIWRQCAWPAIELITRPSSGLRVWLYRIRQQAGDRLRAQVPEPYATLAAGMMWGDDSGLPAKLINDFRRTGTTHLLAVSGFNVMVLTKVIFWLLIAIGLWRQQASAMALFIVGLFVIFSGGESSVVRAGIMGSVLLLGQVLARRADSLNLLLGTGAAMLFVSPRLVVELGWQLSFAAMAGLVYLSPWLIKKLTFLPEFLSLRQISAETLAASLATMPIILTRVSEVSVITPLANLLVAPIAILVYVFGLGLLVLSTFSFTAAAPAVWLLSAVLFYLVTIVNWLASLPWAAVQSVWQVWLVLIVLYLFLAVWLFWLPKKVVRRKQTNL